MPLSKKHFSREQRRHSFSDSIDMSSSFSFGEHKANSQFTINISRKLACPDLVRVDRCHRLPEYGPKILFFSGGTALRDLSSVLKNYTHNSVHLITPFDSGGSSAEIRRAFDMSSVGDLRNRLMALSDQSELGNPEVTNLFSFRLDKDSQDIAESEFQLILDGKHPLSRAISIPMRSILMRHLQWFAERMPYDFDLCGASVGNLIITGCFLEHDQDIVTAIYLIWNLLDVKGHVRLVTGANLHIRTLYEDGLEEVGQHKMGKRNPPSRIQKIDLVQSLEESNIDPTICHIDIVSSDLVVSSDVIVYPMGSFFGSIMVNLLVRGVGCAILHCPSPKVYVPNTGVDPEMYGYTLGDCVRLILKFVQDDVGCTVPATDILNFVLIDTTNCEYCVDIDKEEIEALGIVIIDINLIGEEYLRAEGSKKCKILDPAKVSEVLLTLGS